MAKSNTFNASVVFLKKVLEFYDALSVIACAYKHLSGKPSGDSCRDGSSLLSRSAQI